MERYCPGNYGIELSEEETTLRHRLKLRVERALYRAVVVLQAGTRCQD